MLKDDAYLPWLPTPMAVFAMTCDFWFFNRCYSGIVAAIAKEHATLCGMLNEIN